MPRSTVKAPAMDEWEVKNAVDTLQRAEEIKNNPKMMRAVKKEAEKQKKALDKVVQKTKAKKPVRRKTKK
jgi:hypothetical protein